MKQSWKPTTIYYKDCGYPTGEDVNMRAIADDIEKEKVQHNHEQVISQQSISEKEEQKKSKKPNKDNQYEKTRPRI